MSNSSGGIAVTMVPSFESVLTEFPSATPGMKFPYFRCERVIAPQPKNGRSTLILLLTIGIWWVIEIPIRTLGAANEPATREIGQLISDLDSPSRAVRTQAEQALSTGTANTLAELDTALSQSKQNSALQFSLRRVRRALQTHLATIGLSNSPPCMFSAGGTYLPRGDLPASGVVKVKVRMEVANSVRPVALSFRDSDLSFAWGDERSTPVSPDARRELTCTDATTEFTVDFLTNMPSERTTGQLSGAFRLTCLAGEQEVAFPLDRFVPESRSVGQTECRLLAVTCGEDGLTATLQVAFAPDVKWESYQVEILHQNVALQNADGRRITCSDIQLQQVRGSLQTVVCHFPTVRKILPGDQLTERLPALVTSLTVQVDLKDIVVNHTK